MGQVPNVTWVCCRGKARSPQSTVPSPQSEENEKKYPWNMFQVAGGRAVCIDVCWSRNEKSFRPIERAKACGKIRTVGKWGQRSTRRKGVGGSKAKSDDVYFIFVATVQKEVVGEGRRVVVCSLIIKASSAYLWRRCPEIPRICLFFVRRHKTHRKEIARKTEGDREKLM